MSESRVDERSEVRGHPLPMVIVVVLGLLAVLGGCGGGGGGDDYPEGDLEIMAPAGLARATSDGSAIIGHCPSRSPRCSSER